MGSVFSLYRNAFCLFLWNPLNGAVLRLRVNLVASSAIVSSIHELLGALLLCECAFFFFFFKYKRIKEGETVLCTCYVFSRMIIYGRRDMG